MKPIPELNDKQILLFWKKVDIQGPDDCWNWLGLQRTGKYGRVTFYSSVYQAHRVAYFLATQEDSLELVVCHTCDNPLCCNPRHLWLGFSSNSMRGTPHSGSENWSAKLTEAQAYKIRAMRADGHALKEVAELFGISVSEVSLIALRKRWAHLPNNPVAISD